MIPLRDPAASPEPGDSALLERLRAGEAAAFELLMRRHNRRLYRVARSMLRDAAEAEDALQEAYLAAFRSVGNFRGDASLATWLTRIVANECMTRMRRHARRNNILPIVALPGDGAEEGQAMVDQEPDSHGEPPDRSLWRAELRALLESRIDQLPADFRVVFVMRAVEELSVEETAQCLGIPEATVRTRHFRARSLLRESIAQDLDLAQGQVFDFDGARCDRIVAGVLRGMAQDR
jgi:RNA polymerase sigma-70 factor (ECF subfamily)